MHTHTQRTMKNLPAVACKVDPTNESFSITSVKPRIDQGDAAVSFSVQPHGPSSKEQCEPSGRLSTMVNKKKKENKRNLITEEHKQQQTSKLTVAKLPNLYYAVFNVKILVVSFVYFQSHHQKANTLLLKIFEILPFRPAIDTV